MLECIELFSGAGGLSLGLRKAGIKVRVAVDCDADCKATYELNQPGVTYLQNRVQNLTRNDLLGAIKHPKEIVLAGGPPCQLFSRLNRSPVSITEEVKAYIRLVRSLRPLYVVFENVPAIKRRSSAWGFVVESLHRLGYGVRWKVVNCHDFGVAQRRERMIVIASKLEVDVPKSTSAKSLTVRDAIGHLPEASQEIVNHRSMVLSKTNLKRIKSIRAGGNSRERTASFSDSYARMSWDRPAPTITTKCISFSNGRFGHPVYDRAISVREAANLQSFPETYEFVGSLLSCARQVGNAVPPALGEALGKEILRSFKRHKRKI